MFIEEIFPHENYRPTESPNMTYRNDIALIKLQNDLDSSYMPACLAPKLADYTGKTATVYGWGYIADSKFKPCDLDPTSSRNLTSPVLRMVNQTIISREECSKSTGLVYTCNKTLSTVGIRNVSYADRIFDGMMCSMSPGRGECQGDSGGPFTVNENGKHILVGVVSWSNGCAKVISIMQQ